MVSNSNTFKKLAIKRGNCVYYADNWPIYSEIIPENQHVVGKRHTSLIASNNSNTRHRIARMTIRTKVVSKSEEAVDLTMRLWAYFEDIGNFIKEQNNFIIYLWLTLPIILILIVLLLTMSIFSYLNYKSVIIMDNATFHKSQKTKNLLHDNGNIIEFLPPYSPDLNPIEKKWSQAKALRRKYSLGIRG